MSMLRSLADAGIAADVAGVHAARSPADVLFADELASLPRSMPALAVSVAVSRPGPDGSAIAAGSGGACFP